jgi:hypothetical protein
MRVDYTPFLTPLRDGFSIHVHPLQNIWLTEFPIQRQLFARSERVKGIDFHPHEPWILTTLYSGRLTGAPIWTSPAHKPEMLTADMNRSCLYLVLRDTADCQDVRVNRCPRASGSFRCEEELDCLW